MRENDYLHGPWMKKECDSAKYYLSLDNETLEKTKKKINSFISDDTFKGRSYDNVKIQMECYLCVANAMISANNADIEDIEILNNKVGDELLNGEVIYSNMRHAKEQERSARKKVDEYDRLQNNTMNPVKDAYYQYKKWSYENSAETSQKLYNEWCKKTILYDEIQGCTYGLFNRGNIIREKINIGLKQLGQNFNGREFKAWDYTSWKNDLASTVLLNSTMGFGKMFISCYGIDSKENNGVYKEFFGGSQEWFNNNMYPSLAGDDKELDEAIHKHGCGIIALMNMFYMLEGRTNVSQEEFMKRTRDFVNSHKGVRNTIINGKDSTGINSIYWPIGNNVQSILDDYVKDNTKYSSAEWQIKDADYLKQIDTQLKKGIPVIIQVGLGDPKDKNDRISLYNENGSRVNSTHDHYMTITGIRTNKDIVTGEEKKYLEVSTWGEKYYIDYDEFLEYKKKGNSNNPISDIENGGYNNITIIK